jgi:hypothetical protein
MRPVSERLLSERLLIRSAPWTGAVIAFLAAAAGASAMVPLVFYEWTKFWQAVAIVALGALGTSFGRAVGFGVLTRLDISRAQLLELEHLSDGEKPLKPHLIEDHQQDPELINAMHPKDAHRLHYTLHRP